MLLEPPSFGVSRRTSERSQVARSTRKEADRCVVDQASMASHPTTMSAWAVSSLASCKIACHGSKVAALRELPKCIEERVIIVVLETKILTTQPSMTSNEKYNNRGCLV